MPLKPTPAQKSGIALEGASAQPAGSFRGALLFDYNKGILALKLGNEKLGDLVPYRLNAHAFFAYQLLDWLELAADVPFTLRQGDQFHLLRDALNAPDFEGAAGIRAMGLGDVRLQPRAFLLRPEDFPVGLSLAAEVRLPTGDGQSFVGERLLVAPRLAVERAFGPVRVLGNVGLRLRRHHAQYLNLYVDNEVTLGAGAVVDLGDIGPLTHVQALLESHLATPTSAPFTFQHSDSHKSPWEVLGGVRTRLFGAWGAELDVGRGVTLGSGYGREALRVILAVRYDEASRDSDGDGIPDDRDRCPLEAEDKDGFEDSDGCPDPDNDGDGIPDTEDACPDLAGPKENKGCPDSDGDGIPDNLDGCPTVPGPKENNGCPDSDGDGVPDNLDGCPKVAGPKEYDGCPDSDDDEVPDNVDKCPEDSGPADTDGCPILEPPFVVIESDRIRIKGSILFETGQAKIRKQSLKLLDEVYSVLAKYPDLGPIEIEGHTDNVGSRSYNQDLSDRRSKAVKDYLLEKGIASHRLSNRGYGLDKPIASNATPLGRAKNRRVEFRIIKSETQTAPQTKPGKQEKTP